ncbi:MAG: deoxyribodipyrimidine photolyase [Candidatus Ozemobacteraceae bacterium]
MKTMISSQRLTACNRASFSPGGQFILYWMTTAHRLSSSFALDHAISLGIEMRKPLLILETLFSGRRFDSDRRHAFVLAGLRDHVTALGILNEAGHPGIILYPYVEKERGDAVALAATLAEHACAVVCDEFPAAEDRIDRERLASLASVRVEMVDGIGLLPMRASPRVFLTAHSFRRHAQRLLPALLDGDFPSSFPLEHAALPPFSTGMRLKELFKGIDTIVRKYPPPSKFLLEADHAALASLPIDHKIEPVAQIHGGATAAQATWKAFLEQRLDRYHLDRNHPDLAGASGLSPYLHFGNISVHQIAAGLLDREGWSPDKLAKKPNGRAIEWWGVSEPAERFLDELITWREVGHNLCFLRDDADRYDALPAWARATLAKHASDPRPEQYSREDLVAARTDDPIWNAAQRQLVQEGCMHNYLRMLWGKKILSWSKTPEEAFEIALDLNERFALDGRDPNSISGIGWIFGRYDRPWGPERAIFGTIRYMTSASTARKLKLKAFLDRFGYTR